MAKRSRWLTGFFVFMVTVFFAPLTRNALAESPTEAIKETIEVVFAILRDPALQGEEKRKERNALLRETVAARFDFQEMAKRSLGPHWKRYPAEQERFVAFFSEFLGALYINTIEQGIKAEVFYLREDVDDKYARVDTKVVLPNREGVKVGYQLHIVRGEWRTYDVLLEDMSIVQNYRHQFNRFLHRHSLDELLETMQKKIEMLRQ